MKHSTVKFLYVLRVRGEIQTQDFPSTTHSIAEFHDIFTDCTFHLVLCRLAVLYLGPDVLKGEHIRNVILDNNQSTLRRREKRLQTENDTAASSQPALLKYQCVQQYVENFRYGKTLRKVNNYIGIKTTAVLPGWCAMYSGKGPLKVAWAGPTARLDAVATRKILCSFQKQNPGRPACSSVTILSYPCSHVIFSASTDKVERNCHSPARGCNCVTRRQPLHGFPDTSQVQRLNTTRDTAP
jgi:hypothetical protein